MGDYYIGGSIEAGNVWATKKDISLRNIILSGSVFVGADTIFGPLYFAFGKSEGANQALYMYLGRTF